MVIVCNIDDKLKSTLLDNNIEYHLATKHKRTANKIYKTIYFSQKPQEILDNLNYINNVYPFFKESLYSIWLLFTKLKFFKYKHANQIIEIYFKYCEVFKNCQYNQIFYEKLLEFFIKNSPAYYQDDILSVVYDLSQNVQNKQYKNQAYSAMAKQVIYSINEQVTLLGSIKRALDVIRDPILQNIPEAFLYANITLIKSYYSINNHSMASVYLLKIIHVDIHILKTIKSQVIDLINYIIVNNSYYKVNVNKLQAILKNIA